MIGSTGAATARASRDAAHLHALTTAGLALLALVAGAPSPAHAQNARAHLHDHWSFRQVGTAEWLPATVPGTVHTDLLAAGRIPDPFVGAVEPELQWIGNATWEYRTGVSLPAVGNAAEPGSADRWHTELVFHGLDTYADVYLDGRHVLAANNMFRAWRVDLTDRLDRGSAAPSGSATARPARPADTLELRVVFRPPVLVEDSLAADHPRPLPAGNDPHGTRVFTRKAAYHYGWDWGPRYLSAGIWRPVTLHRWRGATIRDAFVAQDTLTDHLARLTTRLRIEADSTRTATVVIRSPDGLFSTTTAVRRLARGMSDAVVPFEIPAPRRWWPSGLGDPFLYDVAIELHLEGDFATGSPVSPGAGVPGAGPHNAAPRGAPVDQVEKRVGLRTVRLVQEPDSIGRSFHFEVNGAPVFMKGANTVPLDHFSPRADSARYRRMFEDVRAAHMNMLRVWGGGIYERDLFYHLADEHGILIWQDFMFANAMYPGDPAFLASVRAEAEHQLRRLRQHPSIALWCGNNEIREGWENWGWQDQLGYSVVDSATVWAAYQRVFHDILPSAVRALDPDRDYWPSSPSIGWGHPESLTRGDSHYWGVWWGEEPFEVLTEKLPRFMSEFGFQAYPPLPSIERFTEPADRRVGSPVMAAHQKHPRGDELIRLYMARDYPEPSGFDDFVYLSQLVQADGIGAALEAHRRARPRTMGTLYWQLGDTWPVVSWSSVDYYGAWKALHYAARRAFEPVLVSATPGDSVRVHLVSDRTSPASGSLTVRTVPFASDAAPAGDPGDATAPDTGFHLQRRVDLPVNGSAVALTVSRDDVLRGGDPRRTVLVAELVLDDGTRVRDLLYFVPPGELELPDPGLTVRIHRDFNHPGVSREDAKTRRDPVPPSNAGVSPGVALGQAPGGAEGGWVVRIHAEALARAVYLQAEDDAGAAVRFEDNWFDLLPGEKRIVRIQGSRPPRVAVRSLAGSRPGPPGTISNPGSPRQ